MATVMLVGEEDARGSDSDVSMSQAPSGSLQAFVRPAVISDFSNVIPMQSSEFIDSSLVVGPEKMRDGGFDSNENLSPHNRSPLRANELNPTASGIFASNKPVAVFTMRDDSIGDFHETNGGEQLFLATEIVMKADDANLCTKESLDLLNICSNALSEEVSDRGICENKSMAVPTRMNEDMTDLCITNGTHSLAAEIGIKPDDKNLYEEGRYCDSVQILAINPLGNINFEESEKDEVDFGYQHVNLNKGNDVQALEVVPLSDKRVIDAAETFPDDDLIMPVHSSTFGFEDNSKSENLITSDHVKEGKALNMVEIISSFPEENCADHENCPIDKELEEQRKCDDLVVDNHVKGNVFDDKLGLEVEQVNYDNSRCIGNFKADERDKETQNTVNICHQSTCIIENQIIDRVSKMPLIMPQPGKQLMEDSNRRTSEAVFLETLPAIPSSEMKYFIVQHDADILLHDEDRHIDVAREVEGCTSGINMLQNSDLCSIDQVEMEATSAVMDKKCSDVNMLEESRPFDDLHGLVRGFNSLPQFSSSDVGKPPGTIQCVNTDSGKFALSSLVEVSILGGNAEVADPVITEDHSYVDQSLDPAREKYYGSTLKIDGQANVKEADSSPDQISSFFLSENLFTPFTPQFRRRDGGIEWDPSLSTEELLQLSYFEVGKEMGLQHVPYSVANLNESPVQGTTDNLCIKLSMKDKEADPAELDELGDSGDIHIADEQHETCCLTNFLFEKHEGSPVTAYAAMTDEVEKDRSISSSCSSGVDERQREPFEGNHVFVVHQTESDSPTINYWLDRHDSVNSQDIGAEPNDTEMPRGVAEGQSGKVSKLDTGEKYKMEYSIEETVATAKSDQEKVSYTDETVGSEEEIFTGSVVSSVSDSEHHAGEHSSCDGSSPLLSSQVEYSATSSTADNQCADTCQFTAPRSVGSDFNFRGANKLVDQFDECLAKESEEIRKDDLQSEQDKCSDRILSCKRASLQECCGVWDWIRGFRG